MQPSQVQRIPTMKAVLHHHVTLYLRRDQGPLGRLAYELDVSSWYHRDLAWSIFTGWMHICIQPAGTGASVRQRHHSESACETFSRDFATGAHRSPL
jgi:hypothetical protein